MKKPNSKIAIFLLNLLIRTFRYLLFYLFSGTTIIAYGQYGGSTCELAQSSPINFTVGSHFFCENQTLVGNGDDYNSSNTNLLNSFSPTYFSGPDYIYYFTASSTGSITAKVNYESSLTRYHSVSLFEAGPGFSLGNHIAGNYDSNSQYINSGVLAIGNVASGTSYYIVVDGENTWIDSLNNSQYSIEVFYNPISPPCTNLGFEDGNFNYWYGTSGKVQYCNNPLATHANYCPMEYGTNTTQLSIINGGIDPFGGFPCVFEGNYSAMIGDGINNQSNGTQLITTFEVTTTSAFATLNYAMVVNDGAHEDTSQSFIKISMYAQNGSSIDCGDYLIIAGDETLGFTQDPYNPSVSFCPWQTVTTDLSEYIGQNITLIVTIGDCVYGGHYAYAYLDCSCEPVSLITSGCYPLNLTAPSGYDSYLWFPGGDTTRTIENISAGNYCCEMSRNNCTNSLCRDVVIIPFEYSVTTVNSECLGKDNGSACVNVYGVPDFSYYWSDSSFINNTELTSFSTDSLPGGTYFISLTDGLGCTFIDTFEILNDYEIAITHIVNQNASCYGFSNGMATIYTDNYHPPYDFLWPDSTTLDINSNLNAGLHIVTVTDYEGCLATELIEISEPDQLDVPDIHFTTRHGCPPLEVEFSLTNNSNEYTYLWDFTNGENSYQSNDTNTFITFLYGGNYSLTLYYQDENSCVDSCFFENFIRVNPNPQASFYPDKEIMDIFHSVCNFTNQSIGATYYFWDFGDGIHSSLESPAYQFNSVGSFWVELVAFTDKGCSDSIGMYVYVNDIFTFYAPTAFTPDLNGINDVFRVFGTGIDNSTFDLYVYDRWGEVIFESPDIEQGWDGTVKDRFTKAPNDSYVWLATFRDIIGRTHEYSGVINLVK